MVERMQKYLLSSLVQNAQSVRFGRRMRRTRIFTWAPNGWFQSASHAGSGLWGTQCLTLGCPDDFYAVRVGFANINRTPYTVPLIKAVPSTTWNTGTSSYVNPTGDSSWVTLTSANGGASVDRIVTALGAPTSLTVAANTTDGTSGDMTIPAWSWTDWVNVNSTTPDPETNMRVLMIRHLVSNGPAVTYANGPMVGWTGVPAINKGYDYATGGYNNSSDYVTDIGILNWEAAQANRHLVRWGSA